MDDSGGSLCDCGGSLGDCGSSLGDCGSSLDDSGDIMELLSPAGNVEKLYYAYAYGSDAAYIGLKKFSLRVKADNFYEDEYKKVQALKEKFPGRRLHCALNISFHDEEIDALKANLD